MFVAEFKPNFKGLILLNISGTPSETNSYVALVSLLFYWSSSDVAAIVLGARGIVLVVCSIVLSATHVRPYESCMVTL